MPMRCDERADKSASFRVDVRVCVCLDVILPVQAILNDCFLLGPTPAQYIVEPTEQMMVTVCMV